ncbi:hypothetical protein [Deinococcus pimensis]|uniref:hypothetical protein n=1 Tax=Deinococcus pimensis TaxID=309888 RepID=UPI000486018C|nr:hypothetical protein [Deinococcus pimensis]
MSPARRPSDLAAAPAHADLAALPPEAAFSELARRYHRREPVAFRRGGRAGRVHLVRVSDGQPVCRAKLAPPAPGELSATGPLTCPGCARLVAKAVHRTFGRRARRVTPGGPER